MAGNSRAYLINAAGRCLECGGRISLRKGEESQVPKDGVEPGIPIWSDEPVWETSFQLLQFTARGSGRRRSFRCREYRRTRRERLGKIDQYANKIVAAGREDDWVWFAGSTQRRIAGASGECRQRRGLSRFLVCFYSRSNWLLFWAFARLVGE